MADLCEQWSRLSNHTTFFTLPAQVEDQNLISGCQNFILLKPLC